MAFLGLMKGEDWLLSGVLSGSIHGRSLPELKEVLFDTIRVSVIQSQRMYLQLIYM